MGKPDESRDINTKSRADIGSITVTLPFPIRLNDVDLEETRKCHLDWAANLDIWPSQETRAKYEAADFPLFVAYTYPYASGFERKWATDAVGWTWLFDDAFDKADRRNVSLETTASHLDIFRDIIYGRSTPTQTVGMPIAIAFQELVNRMNTIMSERQQAPWEDAFKSFHQEVENNINGVIPKFDDFLNLRRPASGMEIMWDWIEVIRHIELPANVHCDSTFLSLRREAGDVVLLCNDLFSAPREWNDGNTDNIVPVLAQQEQCTWREASKMTHAVIDSKVNSVQRLEEQLHGSTCYTSLTPENQANTDLFIDGMKDWMAGSLAWHINCPRYK